ncbi:MAG: cupredoxin domain-containing protein [Actinobacteria bacterium]|nr:cupredoxin domain-containing protein [Actinomycetota bacterium]
MTRVAAVLAAATVAAAVTAAGYVVEAAATDPAATALGPGQVTVPVDIEHSRFEPEVLTVRAGTLVRFEVDNADPIHHEFIVGPQEVHDAHAVGTERFHPPVPGEVSVGPNDTGMTVYAFDEPGTVEFACHLPGHLDYGMRGRVEVIP